MSIAFPDFERHELIPVVVQDASSGDVLMVAFMDEEAWQSTLDSGYATFFSRSRQQLWRKGETSGNTMQVVSVYLDCDSDSVLLRVRPAGPACHTGQQTCFFTEVEMTVPSGADR